jgi:pilus assembly protein CpaE
MFIQLFAHIVDADAENRHELGEFLQNLGVGVNKALETPDELDELLTKGEPPQVVIINLDPGAAETLEKIKDLPRRHANVSFFVLSQVLDPQLLMEAMSHGFREFVPLPIQEEKFRAALQRVAAVTNTGPRGKTIHVVPTQGGCGSTTVACNVAAGLAKIGKTVLVDLDLARGGVASAFDAHHKYCLSDVMEHGQSVDPQMLNRAIWLHEKSGLHILSRPELPEEALRVNQPGLARLCGVLTRMFDFVVIDSVMSVEPIYSTAIGVADLNLIVMQLNVHSARNAERFVGSLRRMGVEASKIKVLVNRFVKKGWDIDPNEVERALGLEIGWMVPNDFKNAIAAINYGEPVVLRAPRSEIAQSLDRLAAELGKRADRAAA